MFIFGFYLSNLIIFRLNIPNLKDISIPIDESNEQVKEKLKQELLDGNYNIGELIVPQTYTKVTVINNKVLNEEIKIEGRKIPLYDIRRSILQEQKELMRLCSDNEFEKLSRAEIVDNLTVINEFNTSDNEIDTETLLNRLKNFERSRNLMMWHDCSTISNHSHFLVMVSTIYDPAVYLTNEEYFIKSGQKVNVQATIERPHLYIFGRCPSNEQQLLYSEERIEDILQLNEPISLDNSVLIRDIARVFKGDNPAAQLEAGQQKGGHFFCFICKIKACFNKSLFYALNLPYISLQDRIDKIRCSESTKLQIRKNNVHYFSNLKKDDIKCELIDRKVKFNLDAPVKNLRELLIDEMYGIQRLPALMFTKPNASLKELNLERYEILNNEPLHDLSNHVKNLYEEIPSHFHKNIKEQVSQIISTSFNGKETKNSASYRESILIVCNWLIEHHLHHFITDIIKTMCEIQEILYLPDKYRSIQKVFRLNNIIFIHSLLIQKHFQDKLCKLQERKFFGAYYHSIVHHAPEQYRLFSGRSINTEKEEATFHHLKVSSNLTSNHHPDHVISNAMIRLQVRNKLNEHDAITENDSHLNKLYLPIKERQSNTIVPNCWIETHSSQYQRLLERQADYLLENNMWWREVDSGVEFFDTSIVKSMKQLHHFRSTTLKNENLYLKECWNKCLDEKNKLIPAFKLKLPGNNIVYLKTLHSFADKIAMITSEIEVPYEEQHFTEEDDDEEEKDKLNDISEITVDSTKANDDNTNISELFNCTISELLTETKEIFNNTPGTPNITPIIEESTATKETTHQLSSTPLPTNSKRKQTQTKEIISITINPIDKEVKETELGLSKTATTLTKIFGYNDVITEYDSLRKRLKAKKSTKENIISYERIVAMLEVKLKIKKDDLQNKLKENEISALTASVGKRKECVEQNRNIINTLKYIKLVQIQFKS